MRVKIALLTLALAFLSGQVLSGPKVWRQPASKLQGQPEITDGAQVGVFLWQDKAGVHVRWTTTDHPVLFSGRIDLDKPLRSLTRVRQLGSGYLNQSGDRIVMWSATTRGETDGFDLQPGGRRLQIELSIEGKPAEVEQVFLGEKKVNPPGLPLLFSLR